MNEDRLPIDYVTKDYDGFLEMMKEAIPTLTPEWTDTSDSDQGMVILQALSYGLHILGYYQDKAVNENFLHTAQTKKAILLLCRFLGYELASQKPSKSTVLFTKDDTKIDEIIIIPKGTQVSTDPDFGEQIIFETDNAVIIEAGVETGEADVTQGESVTREFVGIGSGADVQKFIIEYPNVIEDDLEVITEENGRDYPWELVLSTIDSKPSDRHYTIELDEEDRTIIVFGDGIFGMRPQFDINIFASYRYGGGEEGNLATGLINTLVDSLITGIDEVVSTIPATGGLDYEDLERARVSAPKAYRSGGKAVTALDFEDQAELSLGVSRALCEETFNEDNELNLYIAMENFEPAPQAILDEIKDRLDKIRIMNSKLNVLNCLYKEIEVEITVHIRDNFIPLDVKEDVEDAINGYFQSEEFEMGAEIYVPKLLERSFSVEGVRNVVIANPLEDVICAFNEYPKLVSVVVNTVGGVVQSGQ